MNKKPPQVPRPTSLTNGQVTVSVVRKHSIRQYETLDLTFSVTADVEPDETQGAATKRLYNQLKKDMLELSNEMRDLAKSREL